MSTKELIKYDLIEEALSHDSKFYDLIYYIYYVSKANYEKKLNMWVNTHKLDKFRDDTFLGLKNGSFPSHIDILIGVVTTDYDIFSIKNTFLWATIKKMNVCENKYFILEKVFYNKLSYRMIGSNIIANIYFINKITGSSFFNILISTHNYFILNKFNNICNTCIIDLNILENYTDLLTYISYIDYIGKYRSLFNFNINLINYSKDRPIPSYSVKKLDCPITYIDEEHIMFNLTCGHELSSYVIASFIKNNIRKCPFCRNILSFKQLNDVSYMERTYHVIQYDECEIINDEHTTNCQNIVSNLLNYLPNNNCSIYDIQENLHLYSSSDYDTNNDNVNKDENEDDVNDEDHEDEDHEDEDHEDDENI